MEAHPYADKFPLLPAEEIAELAESIRANGLRQPIVLDIEGRILDGRNRYQACQLAGVQPTFITYEGDDLAEYVIDCNVNRRNMSAGARAMATALIIEADGRKYGSIFPGEISKPLISKARKIIDYTPHLVDDVVADRIGIREAYEQARGTEASVEAEKLAERNRRKAAREAEQAEQARQTRLLDELKTAAATQYLGYIDTGEMDIPTAYAAWREATRKAREEAAQMDHSRLVTMRAIARAIETLQGGANYADVVWREAYPHEQRLMDKTEHLTTVRIDTAIAYLTRLKEHLNEQQ